MTEAAHNIVTWDEPEPLGPVPGSEWANLADGRPRHLELFRYPEGVHYVLPADTETGELQSGPHCMQNYGPIGEKAGPRNWLAYGDGLPIAPGALLVHTRPIRTDVMANIRTAVPDVKHGAKVFPRTRELDVFCQAPLASVPRGVVGVGVHEDSGLGPMARITVSQWPEDQTDPYPLGAISLTYNSRGMLDGISTTGSSRVMRKALGLWRMRVEHTRTSPSISTVDRRDVPKVVSAVGEMAAIATTHFMRIDMRLTASEIYNTMGLRYIAPLSMVVAR